MIPTIEGKQIEVYPEYMNHTTDLKRLRTLSKEKIIITGYNYKPYVYAALIDDGEIKTKRAKHHLTSGENMDGYIAGPHPFVFEYKDKRILPILCYEICFPKDFFSFRKIDLITHHVGFPMFDKHQFKAWEALQMAYSLHFEAPLICACGGDENELNLSGAILCA